jgi:hypothetical protein
VSQVLFWDGAPILDPAVHRRRTPSASWYIYKKAHALRLDELAVTFSGAFDIDAQ